jgi:hypothetical protein
MWLRIDLGGVSFPKQRHGGGSMEVTVNVQAFRELTRVLSRVPIGGFNIGRWHQCACGHATRDAWFRSQGFISCRSFDDAASFFGITRQEAVGLFSGGIPVTPQGVICRIDNLLGTRTNEQDQAAAQNARRQAIIDDLLRGAHGPATAATETLG